ncbi:MAG: hypothetical protein H8E44_07925 [Planctomycetes bacterium]|nr:hypothetical protein [Planctomycetota bacterium]
MKHKRHLARVSPVRRIHCMAHPDDYAPPHGMPKLRNTAVANSIAIHENKTPVVGRRLRLPELWL